MFASRFFQFAALLFVIACCLCPETHGFALRPAPKLSVRRSTFSQLAAKKPVVEETNSEYWSGDWVCADCGYVYDRDIDGNGKYFEEQKKGFICPQCSAPRKRYAKKVGDQWGVTNDGGDLPIYAFTLLGLAATAWFSLVYVPTL
ncbi:hypothetical protein B484DRAFT_325454 [Ochromonadaceae sp. CCMP2298]|nr:hypothetical protein B484DRAFT_325454 [Ochromonadaceae sp. CCMP2298]|mmetsp:Transcript_8043/g.17487  ORF Transcript_8043/g.17487 Transcript_8043/m.17487 type:complete len:145 (-) Transcript_8043:91-525(-)